MEQALNKIIDCENELHYVNKLELADTIANAALVGTQKGNDFFNNWKRLNHEKIIEIRERATMTVFKRLNKQKKTNTVFDKMRFFKDRKHGI